jgi:hypothetical protein
MVRGTYRRLKYQKAMREAAEGKSSNGMINVGELEKQFLSFTKFTAGGKLTVNPPKMYDIRGENEGKLNTALSKLRGESGDVPKSIDISGGFEGGYDDALIFLSMSQLDVDHVFRSRSYLNSLVEQVYSKGFPLISGFSIHSALFGTVQYSRGNLDLKEVHLFPKRFKPGPYELKISLDTPLGSVARFRDYVEWFSESSKDIKKIMLDGDSLDEITDLALDLRAELGSLSRYSVPNAQTFQTEVPSCVVKDGDTTFFYLYEESTDRNALVYFGDSPFQEVMPKDLLVLNGDEHEDVLPKLVESNFFEVSPEVLKQRIERIKRIADNARRNSGRRSVFGENSSFDGFLSQLEELDTYFDSVANPDFRKKFVLNKSPALLEFAVTPVSSINEDPVLYELLPRISWNNVIRGYHDTDQFKDDFEDGQEEERASMLGEVVSNLSFNHYQNNDVNLWLYNHHSNFCDNHGIEFNVS